MKKFNVNNTIKVKLTDLGYQLLLDIYNKWSLGLSFHEDRDIEYFRDMADEDGYSSFQMWQFIRDFGPVTDMGAKSHYETNILIDIE